MKSSTILPFKSIIKNNVMVHDTLFNKDDDDHKSNNSLDISHHLLKAMHEIAPPAPPQEQEQPVETMTREERKRYEYYKSNPLRDYACTKGQPVIPPHRHKQNTLPDRFT